MTQEEIKSAVEALKHSEAKTACGAAAELCAESEKSGGVYRYMGIFIEMLKSDNSYMRNRACLLIAANAKWDGENKINGCIDALLEHIEDEKPITARQCIKALPKIARSKRELAESIKRALENADTSKYSGSMRPLIKKDIKEALDMIALIK